MPHLPKILAICALIFLLSALIIQQSVRENREKVEIIENTTRPTVTKPATSNGNGNVSKPKDAAGVSLPAIRLSPSGDWQAGEAGIVTVTDTPVDILGENVGQISVNDATFEELDTVPGIGEKTAAKIIDGRPWTDLEAVLSLISKRWREEARGKLKL